MTLSLLRAGHHQNQLLAAHPTNRTSRRCKVLTPAVSAKLANVTWRMKPGAQKGTQRMQPKKPAPKQSGKASFGTVVKRKAKQASRHAAEPRHQRNRVLEAVYLCGSHNYVPYAMS